MGRKKKPVSGVKIEQTNGFLNGFPEHIIVSFKDKEREYIQKDDIYNLSFDFCRWLENLPKGGVSGAVVLLRKFLREKGILDDE